MAETYESALLRRLAEALERRDRMKGFGAPGELSVDLTFFVGRSNVGYEDVRNAVGVIVSEKFGDLFREAISRVDSQIAEIRAELKAIDA